MIIIIKTTKRSGFTLVELLLVLMILLIVAGFVLRIVYHDELRKADAWFAQSFGLSHLWITMPLLAVYVIYRLRSRKKNHSRMGRLKLPLD